MESWPITGVESVGVPPNLSALPSAQNLVTTPAFIKRLTPTVGGLLRGAEEHFCPCNTTIVTKIPPNPSHNFMSRPIWIVKYFVVAFQPYFLDCRATKQCPNCGKFSKLIWQLLLKGCIASNKEWHEIPYSLVWLRGHGGRVKINGG